MSNATSIEHELLAEMRAEIALYRRRGRREDADFLESVVGDVAQKIRKSLILRLCDPLPVGDVAALLGYSVSQLYRLIESDDVPTWKRDGVMVIRPIDCPVKAGNLPALLGITPPPPLQPENSTPRNSGSEEVEEADPPPPWGLKAS